MSGALLVRASIPMRRPCAQQGGGDSIAVTQQFTLFNSKTDKVNQSLTQLIAGTTQLNTKSDQANQANQGITQLITGTNQLNTKAEQFNGKTDLVNLQLTQLITKTDQLIEQLTGVAKQTERIATRLEMRTVTGVGYFEVPVVPDRAVVH